MGVEIAGGSHDLENSTERRSRHRHIVWLGVLVGVLLFFIGVRFLIVPESAVFTFGLASAPQGPALSYVIGLRDLWLGALAVAFAFLRDWRALALWLFAGTAVCWADAAIVSAYAGPPLAIAFHVASGLFCLALGLGAWHRRPRARKG
jgi:Domain of unknown function (DUF4267)